MQFDSCIASNIQYILYSPVNHESVLEADLGSSAYEGDAYSTWQLRHHVTAWLAQAKLAAF
jgi:hypothetical protein